jgi:hypothetical protein
MKLMIVSLFLLAAAPSFPSANIATAGTTSISTPSEGTHLSGSWTLRIENLNHELITTMNIRFGGDVGESCMGGHWRRVVVASQTSTDKHFFPAAEPLSYEIDGDHIVIGRDRVCDAYLQLVGEMTGAAAAGDYISL